MGYYLVLQKEIYQFVTIWMNLEGIMLNEKVRAKNYCIASLICGNENKYPIK